MPGLGEKPCKDCLDNPATGSSNLWFGLPSKDDGGLFFSPVQDNDNPGHFKTFLQLMREKDVGTLEKIIPDGCFGDLDFGRCKVPGCLYVFFSDIDRVRHLLLLHKASKSELHPDGFQCKHKLPSGELCQFRAATKHYVNKHKEAEGHIVRRKKTKLATVVEHQEEEEEEEGVKAEEGVEAEAGPSDSEEVLEGEGEGEPLIDSEEERVSFCPGPEAWML